MTLKITILITSYNYGPYIARALDSAFNQSFDREQFEVLIVDDGSTDETLDILTSLGESARVIQQSNSGLASACNTGINSAKGEYLIRLDADDELHPNSILHCFQILEDEPQIGLVYTDRTEVDILSGTRETRQVGTGNIYDIIAPGIMFRTQTLKDLGSYNHLYWEEHDLMIRYLRQNQAHYLAEPLYVYYLHGSNMTSDSKRRYQGWEELIDKWGMDELRKWGTSPELEEAYLARAPLTDKSIDIQRTAC